MKENNKYKFKFTIITAVYNVELYVEETLKSIINQDIGFKNNVQLILVDDGSTDKGGGICDTYQKKYPKNIKVIHKENGGVSSARNAGFEFIEGKYFNFIDSDDKFSKNTLSNVWKFFEKHQDEIDVCSIPMYFFEARTGEHAQNDKFKQGSRVIDLKTEYHFAQLHGSSSFFHSRMKNNIKFDTRLSIAEDIKFVLLNLIDKKKLGVVANAKYFYRSRNNGTACSNSMQQNPKWYFDVLEFCVKDIVEFCNENIGYIPKFISYALLYDMYWKFAQNVNDNYYLNDPEKFEEYKNLLFNSFKYFDFDLILEHKKYSLFQKYFIAKNIFKKEINIVKCTNDDEKILADKTKIFYFSSTCNVNFHFFEINNKKVTLTFSIDLIDELSDYEVLIRVNDKFVWAKQIDRFEQFYVLDENLSFRKFYKFTMNLDGSPYYFSVCLKDKTHEKLIVLCKKKFTKYFPLNYLTNSYYKFGNYVLKHVDKYTLMIKPYVGKLRALFYEAKYNLQILKSNVFKKQKIVLIRWYYKLYKLFHKKPVWMITDRVNKAGDNGEAFFRFLNSKKIKNIKFYYAISRCNDFNILNNEFKNIIDLNSKKYYLKQLVSSYVISSHADDYVIDPLKQKRTYLRDILQNQNFVFMQHGVTNNDVSDWLNKFNKNIKGLITVSKTERDIFLNTKTYYPTDNVWMTGFARFDRLYDEPKKVITIMPTWRKYLAESFDNSTGIWKLKSDFKESKFFKFYNSLVNDKKLLRELKKYGYKLEFMPHPNIIHSIGMFDKNKDVEFLDINTPYREIYAKSNLILTDYSSAIYDFVYLKKPIIYCHFDKEDLMNGNHVYDVSLNDYENTGFGEVVYNLKSTINLIIDYVKNDCKLKDKYRERIENYFEFHDKNNCERIYNQIIAYENKYKISNNIPTETKKQIEQKNNSKTNNSNKNKPQLRVAVLGSCQSRNLFNFDFMKKRFSIVFYAFQINMWDLKKHDFKLSDEIISNLQLEEFNRRMLRMDANKLMLDEVRKKDCDIVVVDLYFLCRSALRIKTNNDNIYINSSQLSPIFKYLKNNCKIDCEVVPFDKLDEKTVKEGLTYFAKFLKENFNQKNIVIVYPTFNEEFLNLENQVKSYDDEEISKNKKYQEYINKYTDFFASQLPHSKKLKYDDFDKYSVFVSTDRNKEKPSPVHKTQYVIASNALAFSKLLRGGVERDEFICSLNKETSAIQTTNYELTNKLALTQNETITSLNNFALKIFNRNENILIISMSRKSRTMLLHKFFSKTSLGLKMKIEQNQNYIAIVDLKNKVVYENGNYNDIKKFYERENDKIEIVSNFDKSSILINGKEYSKNEKGLNIVEFSPNTHKVIYSFSCDIEKDPFLLIKL